jgi:hypothetical protein
MKMNAEASPMAGPNLAERISALQNAQLSHTGGKRPAGGMQLVMPDFSVKTVKKDEPQRTCWGTTHVMPDVAKKAVKKDKSQRTGRDTLPLLPDLAKRAVEKDELQRTGTEELWLVDSDTWEDYIQWPDAYDVGSPHTKENGCPETIKDGYNMRIISGSSSKARDPVRPLKEKNFHSKRKTKNPVTEPDTKHRRFSKFLSSLSLMVTPDAVSKRKRGEVATTAKPAAAAFSKTFESRADKTTKSQKARVTKSAEHSAATQSAEHSAAVFDDCVRTLSTTSSSQGVSGWLRSMWEDAAESTSSDSKQQTEGFEQSFQSLALLDPPDAASREERCKVETTLNPAATASSKSFERQAVKATKSRKGQVTRVNEPPVPLFDDFVQTLSSTSSSQGVTSRFRSMLDDANESSSNDSKQQSECFEQSFQCFDLNQSKDYETDESPNIPGHATRKIRKGTNSTNRESDIGHHQHPDQLYGNGRATTGPYSLSATTVPEPELREVDSSGKLHPESYPLPALHSSYSESRWGILGIEERIDECEAPKESSRGTNGTYIADVATRSRSRVAPPAPSSNLLPSKEVEEIDRLLSLLNPFSTEERESDSEDLVERSRSFLESRKEKYDSLRSELSNSSEDGLSEIEKSQLATDASQNNGLVASLQSELDQAPRCLSGRKTTQCTVEATNKAQHRSPKRRLDPPASEPNVAKQQTDAPVAKPVAIFERNEPGDRLQTKTVGIVKTEKDLHISKTEKQAYLSETEKSAYISKTDKPACISETDKLSDIKDTLSMKIKETLEKKSFASLLKEAPLQTESGDEDLSAQSSFTSLLNEAPLQTESGDEEMSAQSSFTSLLKDAQMQTESGDEEMSALSNFPSQLEDAHLHTESGDPLQTGSGDEEMSAQSSCALLGGERPMQSLQVDVDSVQGNRSFQERSLSQASYFSPSSLCQDTTPRSAASSYDGMLQPLEMRDHAPDPIRDYWRNFATVKTRGSFDSVSIGNEKDGLVPHSNMVGRSNEYIPGHARIEEHDSEMNEIYDEERTERMHPVRKRVEIREPTEFEQRKSNHRSNYSRATAQVRHEVTEEYPKQPADRLLYVMNPLLSGDTDLESTDAQTQYTDLDTTYTVESDAAEKAQHYSFMCGGLEFGFKGFPGCS